MIKVTRRGLLITVVIILIAGKLLEAVSHLAGAIVEMIALAVYLVFCVRRTFRTVAVFRRAETREKVRAGIWLAVLLAAVNMLVQACVGGDTGFFLVLVLLTIDELSYPKPAGA